MAKSQNVTTPQEIENSLDRLCDEINDLSIMITMIARCELGLPSISAIESDDISDTMH